MNFNCIKLCNALVASVKASQQCGWSDKFGLSEQHTVIFVFVLVFIFVRSNAQDNVNFSENKHLLVSVSM